MHIVMFMIHVMLRNYILQMICNTIGVVQMEIDKHRFFFYVCMSNVCQNYYKKGASLVF